LADAADRRLPMVSVRSGQPADGYLGVPVGLGIAERVVWSVTRRSAGRPVVQLPLTEPEFDQVMRLRRAESSGAVNAVVFVALSVALARFPLLLPLGLTIGAVSVLMVVAARFSLARVVPGVDVHRGTVTIEGAHADFVASVERGGRRYS
jgi:hypothetical protein